MSVNPFTFRQPKTAQSPNQPLTNTPRSACLPVFAYSCPIRGRLPFTSIRGRLLFAILLAVALTACRTRHPVADTQAPSSTITATQAFSSTTASAPANPVTPSPAPLHSFTPARTLLYPQEKAATPTLSNSALHIPTRTPTKYLLPTRPSPKPPSPTPTDYPTLSPAKPYLVYMDAYMDSFTQGPKSITLVDADGTGRKSLPLPDGAQIGSIEGNLSPNGEWLAFHTGSARDIPYDLTLHLMHLPDGAVTTITPLLSKDYPVNFITLAETLLSQYPDQFPAEYYSVDYLISALQDLLTRGIYSVAWSPDSRYLAFAGQMDGISSDIYRYDMNLHTITRLTDGIEQIVAIAWSPDGKWILHEAYNAPLGEGWMPDIFAVQWDGSRGKKILENIGQMRWVSPSSYVVHNNQNGIGNFDLRWMDIETDQPIFHWPSSFDDFTFDPAGQILIFDYSFDPGAMSDENFGFYIIEPGIEKKFIHEQFTYSPGMRLYPLGSDKAMFLVSDYGGVQGITRDGEIIPFSDANGWVYVSPDRNWVLITQDGYKNSPRPAGAYLYTAQGEYIKQVSFYDTGEIAWRPDSQAFIYQVDTSLFYQFLSGGKSFRIDTGIRRPSIGWIK